MELPQSLLDRYHVGKPSTRKAERKERTPMYRTFPCMLTFADGTVMDGAEFTMPNKPYWAGQLEEDIMREYNKKVRPDWGQKVVRVKVYRNSRPGGILVDTEHGRVINVY